MARYATTEKLYQCPLCDTRFALREADVLPKDCLTHECPQCEDAYIAFASLEDSSFVYWGSRSGRVEGLLKPSTWNHQHG